MNNSYSALLVVGLAVSLLMPPLSAPAGVSTWNLDPTSGDWNTAGNWTPATVPNGSFDVARFEQSNVTAISLSGFGIEVSRIAFNPAASSFSINTGPVDLSITGAGIINHSAATQGFVVAAPTKLEFFNQATAGRGTSFIAQGDTVGYLTGGVINFWDDSNAGYGSFTLEGGGSGTRTTGGRAVFIDSANAAHATFVCEAGGDGSFGGTLAYVAFYDTSSAGNATLIAESSTTDDNFNGVIIFDDESRAENATLIARGHKFGSGGAISFLGGATGDKATVQLSGSSHMDMFLISSSSLSIGSLEGKGSIYLGSKNLTIGANNKDTSFEDFIFGPGTVSKIGLGTFTLTGANIYEGGTFLEGGTLLVENVVDSATGTGPVQIDHGTFGGNGLIAGAVTVGDGVRSGAALAPRRGVLTLQTTLTLRTATEYRWNIATTSGSATAVSAWGVTIDSGVNFVATSEGSTELAPGTVFTAITNNDVGPIAGTFANLADGATLAVGPNTFQADYEGGDGNDLTLTVISP